MNRRNFIYYTSSLLASLFLKPSFTFASGNAGNGKRIIALNKIGGWDGHGTIAYGANASGDLFRSTYRPDIYPDLDDLMLFTGQQVGLHSAYRDLHETEAAGKIKLILNAGIMQSNPGASHSHSQKVWEKGDIQLNKDGAVGWIGRLMDEYDLKTGQVLGIGSGSKASFSRNIADEDSIIITESLSSYLKTPLNFGRFDLPMHYCDSNVHPGGCQDLRSSVADDNLYKDEIKERLEALKNKTGVTKRYSDSTKLADENIGLVQSMNNIEVSGNYLREGSTSLTRFGRHCTDAAKVIKYSKTDKNLAGKSQIIYLQRGGWDNHNNYNSVYTGNLTDINAGLRGLIQDLKAMGEWENTAIVAFSEFGRTIKQNGVAGNESAGLDHGYGNNLMVMGGAVSGGITGDLNTVTQLQENNRFTPVVDCRRIFSELLTWAGYDSSRIFGPLVDTKPVGLFT